jgi:hypothetical protein
VSSFVIRSHRALSARLQDRSPSISIPTRRRFRLRCRILRLANGPLERADSAAPLASGSVVYVNVTLDSRRGREKSTEESRECTKLHVTEREREREREKKETRPLSTTGHCCKTRDKVPPCASSSPLPAPILLARAVCDKGLRGRREERKKVPSILSRGSVQRLHER